MRHRTLVAKVVLIALLTTLAWSWTAAQPVPEVTPEPAGLSPAPTLVGTPIPPGNEVTYTVRPGDTLFRIALRFNTTVSRIAEANGITNPALIYAGRQLRIPGAVAPTAVPTSPPKPTSAPTATVVPVQTNTYTVQRGDTLFRIALRNRTTVSQLVALNNLANPNVIYVGQVLKIPASGAAQSSLSSTAVPATQPPSIAQPTQSSDQGGAVVQAGYGFSYGVEAFLVDQDVTALTGQITSLGMKWVKQTVYWRDFEPVKGEIDFATLDNIINSLHDAGLNILLTVTAAPAWTRSNTDENGPPDNFSDYGAFIGALAQRYTGKVQAYEIWNEPNLRREWNSTTQPIGATSYIQLLKTAFAAVKAADPAAVVLSAGLAPTGFNDKVNAVDDRQFLRDLYASGLAEVSDAVGAHPLGWANPPDAECCVAPVGVETHYESPSFFFRNTLNDYRQIMVASKDSSTPIWVTKFGWGSSEDTQPPSDTYVFLTYTTLGEQAIYDPRAFEVGTEFGFVGPMFLDNLNGCQAGTAESCFYALIGPDGAPRPVFGAIQTLIQAPADLVAPVDAVPTAESVIEQPTAESFVEQPTAEPPVPETTQSP